MGVSLWLIGSVGVWAGVWFWAPPHDSTAQNLAPNESVLRRLGLQMTSFSQDGNGHTEMYWLHFSIVEGSRDASSIFFYNLWS